MKLLFFAILFFITDSALSQVISGFVLDSLSKEPLIGVAIYCTNNKKAVVTNNYGFYSLKLSKDSINEIWVYYFGYNKKSVELVLSNNNIGTTILLNSNTILPTIEITDNAMDVNSVVLKSIDIKKIPTFLGESDAIKAFQTQPGVKQGAEGFGSLLIRGGSADQVQYVLDDMPLYYVNHMGGFISTFNTDAISKVELFKNHIPANYTGRLSGVFDVRLKEGNANKWGGTISVGLLSTRLNFNGPVIKNKSTLEISARRLNIDLLTAPYFKITKAPVQPNYFFSDVMLKYTHKLSNKHKLSFTFFNSYDAIKIYTKNVSPLFSSGIKQDQISIGNFKYNWSNTAIAFRLMSIVNSRIFITTVVNTGYFSNNLKLSNSNSIGNIDVNSFETTLKLNLKNLCAKSTLDYTINNNLNINTGISYELISSGFGDQKTINKTDNAISEKKYQGTNSLSHQVAIFGTCNYLFFNKLKTSIGLNGLYFKSKEFSHVYIQPRLYLQYPFSKNNFASVSYCQNVQPMHLLTNNGVGMPNDIWVPADEYAKPQQSKQLNLNYTHYFFNKKFSVQSDLYYKTTTGLIRFTEGFSVFSTKNNWHSTIETNGKGLSYGLEILAKKELGKLTGFLAYTLSKTTNQFDNVNNGKPFYFKYDRRHEINLFSSYELNKNININANFYFATGNPLTLPVGIYNTLSVNNSSGGSLTSNNSSYLPDVNLSSITGPNYLFYYDGINQQRSSNFHRLDIGISLKKQKKHGVRVWSFGIYNVYNHQNPFAYHYEYNYAKQQLVLNSVSVFQIMPYFTYEFKF